MKIACLSAFYPYRGGIAQFNASLFRAFENQNHEIKAYTFSLQYPEMLFPGKTQVVTSEDNADAIPAERILNTVNPFSYLKTIKSIANFAPDVLIMRYWMPFFAPSLGTIARQLRKKGIKVITILDNVIPHEKRMGDAILNNYFLSQNDAFVVMSSSVKQDLLTVRPEAKFLFHPHPLYSHFGKKYSKEAAREELSIPKDKKVLLFFGLIRDYKGLDIAIETMNLLSEEYVLLIAGEPYGDFKKYKKAIDENKNKARIKVNTSYIPDHEVPLYFSAADCCLLPYKTATQSGIISISYHFDLPVIVTDVGSLREMVVPYEAGIVIDKPQASSFVKGIQTFFEKGKSNAYQKNIQEFKKKYSWENLAQKILSLAEKE